MPGKDFIVPEGVPIGVQIIVSLMETETTRRMTSSFNEDIPKMYTGSVYNRYMIL